MIIFVRINPYIEMGRQISKYNLDDKVELTDKVIGTESDSSKTKNYKIEDILALQDERYLPILLAYKYADSNSSYDETVAGYFTANSDDLSLLTQLKFNKISYTGDSTTEYLRTIETLIATATYEFNLKASDNSPNYVRFLITAITEELQYFQIDGQIIVGSSSGDFNDEEKYLFHDVKTSSTGAGADMYKSTYDTNDSGVVDDAEKVNGFTVETAVPTGAVFVDTHLNLQEGANISIDKTDPLSPIITASDSGENPLIAGATVKIRSFIAIENQTDFVLFTTPVATWIWVNGAIQDATTWSVALNTITLDTGLIAGDAVEVYYLENVANLIDQLDENTLILTGGTSSNISDFGELFITLETSGATYVLPLLSGLISHDFTINLKNISGGVVTVETLGADLIDNLSSVSLSSFDNLRLHISTNNYYIL